MPGEQNDALNVQRTLNKKQTKGYPQQPEFPTYLGDDVGETQAELDPPRPHRPRVDPRHLEVNRHLYVAVEIDEHFQRLAQLHFQTAKKHACVRLGMKQQSMYIESSLSIYERIYIRVWV